MDYMTISTTGILNLNGGLYVDSATDYVGIGTGAVSPTVALDVVGALKVSNYISVTNAVGCGDLNSGGSIQHGSIHLIGNVPSAYEDVLLVGINQEVLGRQSLLILVKEV